MWVDRLRAPWSSWLCFPPVVTEVVVLLSAVDVVVWCWVFGCGKWIVVSDRAEMVP